MRAHYIVIATLTLIGVGVKVASFATLIAESDSRSKGAVHVSQMQQNLPIEKFHDMTFVFPVRPGSN